jgi:hypothetical protein
MNRRQHLFLFLAIPTALTVTSASTVGTAWAMGFPATGQTTAYTADKNDNGGLHDKDNGYTWTGGGDTIWDWLDHVNAEGGTSRRFEPATGTP